MNQVNLFVFPLKLKHPNAYWDLLYERIGQVSGIKMYHNDFIALIKSFGKNIVHIHWTNIMYASRYNFLVPVKFLLTTFLLALTKLRGDRLVWTMHNYHDHESRHKFFDRLSVKFLVIFADAIIVHTKAGADYLKEELNRKKFVYIIPHGHYVDFYGQRLTQPDQNLLKKFNISLEDKVFISLGAIRPYKGLEVLIDIFNTLPGNYKLLIAGKPFFPKYTQDLKRRISNSNIIFSDSLVPEESIPKYFSLANFSIFAFSKILTSGSVIMSLSYGVPAIVPAIGDLQFVVQDGFNGYKYSSREHLKKVIEKVSMLSQEEIDLMKSQALEGVKKNTYQDIADKTLQAYNLKEFF